MFERLRAFFHRSSPPRTPLPELDAAHALGALLVKVALVDDTYLFEEVEQIDRILGEACDLPPLRAARMRASCERLAFETPGVEDMAARIREGVDLAHRRRAVEALWTVVRADGTDNAREAALVELIVSHLGLDEAESRPADAAIR